MFTWHDFVFICCNGFPYFDNIFFRIECFQNDDLNEYSVIQIYVWLNSQNKIFITVFLLFNSFCSKKNYPFDEIALLWCFFHYTLSVFLENRIWTAKCQLQTTEAVSRPWNVIKKKLQYRYFLRIVQNFFNTAFTDEHLWTTTSDYFKELNCFLRLDLNFSSCNWKVTKSFTALFVIVSKYFVPL